MGKPPKIDRKALKQPDEFVTSGRSFVDVLVDHRKSVGILVGVVCAVAAIYYSYSWWNQRQLNRGWLDYLEVSKMEKPEEKWAAMAGFFEKASNLRPRYQAAIDLGDHYFGELKAATEDPKKEKPSGENLAVKWYSNALSYGALLPMERQLVLINLGQSYELSGDRESAKAQYESAAAIEGEAKGLALLNVGRVYELLGDTAKAKENYEKVTKDFAGTEYARLAKNYQRAIDSPLVKELSGK
ncbi:MAG: tetratricopeptide repeat protein [Bdellovibrionales bacterium]|nr:tetratricopeptide repeat protein [Bdellovibrionales bacterium]